MPKFKVNYEEVVSYTCSIIVEAKNSEEAIEIARELPPNEKEWYDSSYSTFETEKLKATRKKKLSLKQKSFLESISQPTKTDEELEIESKTPLNTVLDQEIAEDAYQALLARKTLKTAIFE